MSKKVKIQLKLILIIVVISVYFIAYDNLFIIPAATESGRLTRENGVWVLYVKGSPYEMGYAHGKLLKAWIKQSTFGYIDLGLMRIAHMDYDLLKEHARRAKKHIPDAQITYAKKPSVVLYPELTRYDDSNARKEWDWQPVYDSVDKIAEDIINEVRLHPKRHGFK